VTALEYPLRRVRLARNQLEKDVRDPLALLLICGNGRVFSRNGYAK